MSCRARIPRRKYGFFFFKQKTAYEIFSVVFVDFEEISIVNDRMEDVLDVVWLLGIGGDEGGERGVAAGRRGRGGAARGGFGIVSREKKCLPACPCPAKRIGFPGRTH